MVQPTPGGLPEAFIYGEDFIDNDDVTLILGDNIFDYDFSEHIKNFKGGGEIYAKKVHDPERFGVIEFDDNKHVVSIEEKPQNPKSDFASVGIYTFDSSVVEHAKNLQPSARGELEMVDLHNIYLKQGKLRVNVIDGIWEDAGTFDSLLRAGNLMQEKAASEKEEGK